MNWLKMLRRSFISASSSGAPSSAGALEIAWHVARCTARCADATRIVSSTRRASALLASWSSGAALVAHHGDYDADLLAFAETKVVEG